MFLINRLNQSRTTISIDHLFNNSKNEKRRKDITTTITITSIISNLTFPSLSTTTIPEQQISVDEPYSAKTGIKIAALLGGMLLFVVIYVLWKARTRICHSKQFSSTSLNNSHLPSSSKFDLDYWLKQVDLLEAKEAERNRESLSPYLELPREEPRNNQIATASWIGDTWRQWRLMQYREHRRLLQRPNENIESNPVPYRRRRYLLRRLIRRILMPPPQNPSFLIEQSSTLIADLRPSIVNNNLIPPPETLDVQPRRVASWPRLKSTQHQNSAMSALQTHNARKRLLKRSSKTTTFDI